MALVKRNGRRDNPQYTGPGSVKPGYDGAKVSRVPVKLSGRRTGKQSVRSLPGTFEWRFGRGGAGQALYEAGTHFARLWEQAGLSSVSSIDLGGRSGEGWKSVPDHRLEALDALKAARPVLGHGVCARLVDYCAVGLTADKIGRKYGITKRNVAVVLENDLKACAEHFRYC